MDDGPSDSGLPAIDDALVRLRRLWSPSHHKVIDDQGRRIEMSSVIVVEACARGEESGVEVGVRDIAVFADVEQSTASRLIDRAEQAGLVERLRSAVDSRRTAVRLTAEGRALRGRAAMFRMGWLSAVVAGWSESDVDAFGTLLLRFADSVADMGLPPGKGGPS